MVVKTVLHILITPISNIPTKYIFLIIAAIIGFECVINSAIIQKVNYTEIDWIAYMQEVTSFINGERNYNNIRGDTGPLVYPAGFICIFSFLRWVTENGSNIRLGQYIFFGIYMLNLLVILTLYITSETKSLPLWSLALLVLSKRIHSIYVLRMFNDCIAVLFGYIALYYFTKHHWRVGCLLYSISVSIKMNMLLQAPGILLLLLMATGFQETIICLSICAGVQLILGYPFLSTYPVEYLMRSFDIGRVFMFEWTVNFKFLPEAIFVSKPLSIGLLLATVVGFSIFWRKWILEATVKADEQTTSANINKASAATTVAIDSTSTSHLRINDYTIASVINFWGLLGPQKLSHHYIIYIVFVSNFIGISFARSLHYQFYCWYYHTLPYLLFTSTSLPTLVRVSIVLAVEVAFNIFPATWWSSLLLQVAHLILLVALCLHPSPSPTAAVMTTTTDNPTDKTIALKVNNTTVSNCGTKNKNATNITDTVATTNVDHVDSTFSTVINDTNITTTTSNTSSSSSSSRFTSDNLSLHSSRFPPFIIISTSTTDDFFQEDTVRTTQDTDRTTSYSTKIMNNSNNTHLSTRNNITPIIIAAGMTAISGLSGEIDTSSASLLIQHRPDSPRWGDDSAISISPTNHSRQNNSNRFRNGSGGVTNHNSHSNHPNNSINVIHEELTDNNSNSSCKQYTSMSSNSHTSSGSNESTMSISKPLWGNDDPTITLSPVSIYITHSQRANESGVDTDDISQGHHHQQAYHHQHRSQQVNNENAEEEEEEILPPMEVEIVRINGGCIEGEDYDDFVTINSANTNDNDGLNSNSNNNNISSNGNNLFANSNWPPKDSTQLNKVAKLKHDNNNIQQLLPPLPSSSSPTKQQQQQRQKKQQIRRNEVLDDDESSDIDPNIAWPKDSTKLVNMSKLKKDFH